MRCAKCDRPIFEGDSGWYCQEPVEVPGMPGFVFMDRMVVCGPLPPDAPHPMDPAFNAWELAHLANAHIPKDKPVVMLTPEGSVDG